MTLPSISYKRHRFPPAIIAHAVWLYYRFPLSLRLVEEMLLERGIVVSYETVQTMSRIVSVAEQEGLDHFPELPLGTVTRAGAIASAAASVGCGGRSIRTAISSMKSSKRDATPRRQGAC